MLINIIIMSIKKPQSAFQYYLKAWKDFPPDLKEHFYDLEKMDKERYEEEVEEKKYKEEQNDPSMMQK